MNALTTALLSLALAFTAVGCVAGETDVAGDTDQAAASACPLGVGLGSTHVAGRIVATAPPRAGGRNWGAVEVQLVADGAVVASDITTGSGEFLLVASHGVVDVVVRGGDFFEDVVIRRGVCLETKGEEPASLDVGAIQLVDRTLAACESLRAAVDLSGKLVQSTGAGVEGVQIDALRGGRIVDTVWTNSNGGFRFGLPPGHYDFEIRGTAVYSSQRFPGVLLGDFDAGRGCYSVTKNTAFFPYQTISLISQ